MKQTNFYPYPQLCALAILISLSFCSSKKTETNPISTNITESVYASGKLKSADQYELYSPVNGIIQDILVKEGDSVATGEIIMRIVSEKTKLEVDKAKMTLDHSLISSNRNKLADLEVNLDLQKSRRKNDSLLFERQKQLWAAGIGTRNELEQRELILKNDIANYNSLLYKYNDLQNELNFSLNQAKNNLEITKTINQDYFLRSKINGRVYKIMKEKGEMISTLNSVAIIGGNKNFLLELQVDEYDIAKVKIGQSIMVSLDSYKNQVFEGTVTRIIPFMNDRTKSFTFEAVFINSPKIVYPNQTVEANIIIQIKNNVLTIPREYLVNDSMILMKNGEKKKVITGLRDYQKVEIIKGLTPADIIVKPLP